MAVLVGEQNARQLAFSSCSLLSSHEAAVALTANADKAGASSVDGGTCLTHASLQVHENDSTREFRSPRVRARVRSRESCHLNR